MKGNSFIFILFLLFIGEQGIGASSGHSEEEDINKIIASLNISIKRTRHYFHTRRESLQLEFQKNRKRLQAETNLKAIVSLLVERDNIRTQINQLLLKENSEISKIRYIKGLQIIKILYEKTLALDHHFASVSTFQEINKISNPNNYENFGQIKKLLENKKEKKYGFGMGDLLGNNIYTSVVHSFISLFTNSDIGRAEKENQIANIECILDFTLSMHNDLNTIFFETIFLQKSNDNIQKELQQLFVDYSKPIKYTLPLKECRNSDDWDTVREYLAKYISVMDQVIQDESQAYKSHKMQINLEFPIDRLLQFITQYNAFINQGSKFYEKFAIMLNSYAHKEQCSDKIPIAYSKLEENIHVAIEKFNTAYKPIEINGSKMKEVLYGLNEYD